MLPIALIGAATVALTVLLHAAGTGWWLERLRKQSRRPSTTAGLRPLLSVLVRTTLVLVALHVSEVLVWAVVLRLVPGGGLDSLDDAVYLSFVTFSTLGYGDITLQGSWRLLAGVEALNGVILLGWSTALSFAVIQRAWSGRAGESESSDRT